MLLIGVTILYERITECATRHSRLYMLAQTLAQTLTLLPGPNLTRWLEENVFNSGIKAALWQKITRELTILGFVSFSATITLQMVNLEEESELLFEYAHVLMFSIAIFYALEIANNSFMAASIASGFARQDQERDEELLAQERSALPRADRGKQLKEPLLYSTQDHVQHPSRPPAEAGHSSSTSRPQSSSSKLSTLCGRVDSRLVSSSQFRILRFHFMARSGLLGKARFEWAAYVTRSMEHQLKEMLELTTVNRLS